MGSLHMDVLSGNLGIAASAKRIDPRRFVGVGVPSGVLLDAQDAPALAREIEGLCGLLKKPVPGQIVFTAELALRVHEERALLGLKRQRTLGIGWPLLFILDADELRAALALALCTDSLLLPPEAAAAADSLVASKLDAPLLARTLSRLYAANALAQWDWLAHLLQPARKSEQPPDGCLRKLRQMIEKRGRADWQGALDQCLGGEDCGCADARLQALGGSDVRGGSHRNVAQAWLWEGLTERLTTALERNFQQLLAPVWREEHARWSAARMRAGELESARRARTLDVGGQIELAGLVELLVSARTAHALYRDLYTRERRPEVALAIARTLAAFDPQRARPLLEKLSASTHPLAASARMHLDELPIASARPYRQTSTTDPPN